MNEHPLLNAGYNSAPLAYEELNGIGWNQPTTVAFFETAHVGRPLIQPTEFWSEVDARVSSERNSARVPRENTNLKVRDR